MTVSFRGVLWIVFILSLLGCSPPPVETQVIDSPLYPDQPVKFSTESQSAENTGSLDHLNTITVLYTNDEHGWMEGVTEGLGAANMMTVWKDNYGYTPDEGFLIFSGGDMWSGAATSTWFQGASMVQVMNNMDYSAATVGNHEFDFGLDTLALRASEMAFPLLSANIRYKSGGRTPTDLGIQAYAVLDVSGVSVGVIGLTTTDTPETTLPNVVEPFNFIDYEIALREVTPQVREAGVDMIMVLAHACRYEIDALAMRVTDLNISLIGGGHCNDFFSTQSGETVVLSGGSNMQSFAYAEFLHDSQADKVTILDHGIARNRPLEPAEELSELIDEWRSEADLILDEVIGYAQKSIPQRSNLMETLVIEPWLLAYPNADVALTNIGGIRADIKAGDITIGDIITVLPFENTIIDLEMTGKELRRVIINKSHRTAVAGLTVIGGNWIFTKSGKLLDPQQSYHVLVNSFMYAGGDGYDFVNYDPDGYDTNIHYRQPLLDWLRAQSSSESMPISKLAEIFWHTY